MTHLADWTDWIELGDVARRQCGMQSQYCSRYIDGRHDHPRLGEGLRFRRKWPTHTGDDTVDPADYHNVLVHKDDAAEFAKRVNAYRRATYQIA